uniref:Serine/arginine repetitive matrix protein 2 n=1 Tax=Panagrellus redivivus TaxID=6233 RepID=A0A7E4VLY2_PANRE
MNNGKPVIVNGMVKRYKCVEEYVALDENGNVIDSSETTIPPKPVVPLAADPPKNVGRERGFSLSGITKVKTAHKPPLKASDLPSTTTTTTTTTPATAEKTLKHMPSVETESASVDLYYDEDRESGSYEASTQRGTFMERGSNEVEAPRSKQSKRPIAEMTRDAEDYQYYDHDMTYLNRMSRYREQRRYRPIPYYEFPEYETGYNDRRDSYQQNHRRFPPSRALPGGYANYFGQKTVTSPPPRQPLHVVDEAPQPRTSTYEPALAPPRMPIKTPATLPRVEIKKMPARRPVVPLSPVVTTAPYKSFEQETEEAQRSTLAPATTATPPQSRKKFSLQMTPENCKKVNELASSFFVSDPRKWIRQNCNLASMFAPGVTCDQLTKFVDSCYLRRFL